MAQSVRAKQHRPESENSAGPRQGGSRAEQGCLFERLWQPEGWVRWQRQPPEHQWSRGQCRPPVLLPTYPQPWRLLSRPLRVDGTGGGGGEGGDGAVAPGPVSNNSQDLFSYRMEFVQVLPSPQPSPPHTPHPQVACPQLEVDAEVGGGQTSKTCTLVQSTKGSKHKRGEAQRDLVSPSSPPPHPTLCRRAPFQLWSCVLSLVRDPREQLGHSHEPL